MIRLGGFRRAAERLNTTQPAVSARIGQLENSVGAVLINRSSGRIVTPTPKGLEMFGYAERILRLHDEMQASMAGESALHGTVRLGVSETLVHAWLPPLLRELHDRHPELVTDIVVDTSPVLQQQLQLGELDLSLLLGPVNAAKVQNLPLGEYPLAWLCSPTLDLGNSKLTLADMVRWPILTYARGTKPYQQVAALFDGPIGVPTPRIFSNSSLSTIVKMTLDGIGIGVIPPIVVAGELADGRLRAVHTDIELAPLTYTASYLIGPDNACAAAVAKLARGVAATYTAP